MKLSAHYTRQIKKNNTSQNTPTTGGVALDPDSHSNGVKHSITIMRKSNVSFGAMVKCSHIIIALSIRRRPLPTPQTFIFWVKYWTKKVLPSTSYAPGFVLGASTYPSSPNPHHNCGSMRQEDLNLGLQGRCSFCHPQLQCPGWARDHHPLPATPVPHLSSVPRGQEASTPWLQGLTWVMGVLSTWKEKLRLHIIGAPSLRIQSPWIFLGLPEWWGIWAIRSYCLALKHNFFTHDFLGTGLTLVCLSFFSIKCI